MIALLIVRWLHYLSKAEWPFSNMVVMFRMNLLTYRNLKAWPDDPFEKPPQPPGETQMALEFSFLWRAERGITLSKRGTWF